MKIIDLVKNHWSQFKEITYKEYVENKNDENYVVLFDQDSGKQKYYKKCVHD